MKIHSVVEPFRPAIVTTAIGLAFGSTALLTTHYLGAAQNLAAENGQLKEQMQILVERVADVEGEMSQVAAARKQMDRTTLAGLGAALEHAGVPAGREARLSRALAPVEELGPRANLGAAILSSGRPPVLAPKGPTFITLLDRMGSARDRAGRLAADVADTAAVVADRRQILNSLPSILPSKGNISSEFGMRESPFHAGVGMHNGIDVAAEEGKPVVATADGTVTFAGNNAGFGKLVTIDHGFGITTKYGHNSALLVKKGDRVLRGQSIAAVGNTGRSTGAHVHYEIALYDKPVDPRRFLFDAAPEETAPQAPPLLAHLALGGDAPGAWPGAPEGSDATPERSGVEWDAPVFAMQGGLLFAHAPHALHTATTGDAATAAICFLLLAVAAAVMRVPTVRRKARRSREASTNADLVREFQRKERLKRQAAEF